MNWELVYRIFVFFFNYFYLSVRAHRSQSLQRMRSRRTISNIFSLILFCACTSVRCYKCRGVPGAEVGLSRPPSHSIWFSFRTSNKTVSNSRYTSYVLSYSVCLEEIAVSDKAAFCFSNVFLWLYFSFVVSVNEKKWFIIFWIIIFMKKLLSIHF